MFALLLLLPQTVSYRAHAVERPGLDPTPIQVALQPKTTPSFDDAVLKPLRVLQAAQAERQRIIDEEAAKQAQIAAEQAAEQARIAQAQARVRSFGSYGNNYTYGQCTWYVASRISVPSSMGDARNWGFVLGSHPSPIVGSIAWTTAGWAGHVAIVEQVSNGSVYISEMNAMGGAGVIDYRWASVTEFQYLY